MSKSLFSEADISYNGRKKRGDKTYIKNKDETVKAVGNLAERTSRICVYKHFLRTGEATNKMQHFFPFNRLIVLLQALDGYRTKLTSWQLSKQIPRLPEW